MQNEIPLPTNLEQKSAGLILLVDTCGSEGSLALALGGSILADQTLPARAASAELLPAIHRLLEANGYSVHDLSAIGVVSGPGSFTGVRVGLAAAKGLCEALALPLAAVSRLAVLASAADLHNGLAVLDAGRDELYIREVSRSAAGCEFLLPREALATCAAGRSVVTADPSLASTLNLTLQAISARDALPLVLQSLAKGGNDIATTDANYVRGESQLYAPKAAPGA